MNSLVLHFLNTHRRVELFIHVHLAIQSGYICDDESSLTNWSGKLRT